MITLSNYRIVIKNLHIYNIYQFKETTLTRKEWAKLEILNPFKFKVYLHKLHYFRKYFILKFRIILPRLILVKQVIFQYHHPLELNGIQIPTLARETPHKEVGCLSKRF